MIVWNHVYHCRNLGRVPQFIWQRLTFDQSENQHLTNIDGHFSIVRWPSFLFFFCFLFFKFFLCGQMTKFRKSWPSLSPTKRAQKKGRNFILKVHFLERIVIELKSLIVSEVAFNADWHNKTKELAGRGKCAICSASVSLCLGILCLGID